MKIALIKPPATYADWYHRPILGLSYIAAYLEKYGFSCALFDAQFQGWAEEDLVRRVGEYGPDVVGITAMTHEIVAASRIAEGLKGSRPVTVVIGGCHATALPRRTLEEFPAFDIAVRGEGEETSLELVRCLETGAREGLGHIQGIAFRDAAGGVQETGPRPFMSAEALNALPCPAFHQYYGDDRRALAGKDLYYVMISGRGCPFNCAFCMRVLGRRIRRRSPENICGEIEHAIERFGAHTIDFADEVFLIDNAGTRELLEMMIARGFPRKIRWSGLVHASFVCPELIALAKKAGCCRLEMGVESGDDAILKGLGKGITVAQVKRAVGIIKDAGISLATYFILGHPHETKETVRKTIDLAVSLNTDDVAFGIMVPYPGTRVREMALRGEGGYRLLTEDWSCYDKYFSRSLEMTGVPYEYLAEQQARAIVEFYARNFRFAELARLVWQKRHALVYLMRKAFHVRDSRYS